MAPGDAWLDGGIVGDEVELLDTKRRHVGGSGDDYDGGELAGASATTRRERARRGEEWRGGQQDANDNAVSIHGIDMEAIRQEVVRGESTRIGHAPNVLLARGGRQLASRWWAGAASYSSRSPGKFFLSFYVLFCFCFYLFLLFYFDLSNQTIL